MLLLLLLKIVCPDSLDVRSLISLYTGVFHNTVLLVTHCGGCCSQLSGKVLSTMTVAFFFPALKQQRREECVCVFLSFESELPKTSHS